MNNQESEGGETLSCHTSYYLNFNTLSRPGKCGKILGKYKYLFLVDTFDFEKASRK